MAEKSGLTIRDWHAHVYFDPGEAAVAQSVCAAMRDALGCAMGRIHYVPIGPHPRGSCQMTVSREIVGDALEWLFAHRNGLTVFVHGNSGDDWIDHTRHVLWIGPPEQLDLSIFASPKV